MLVAGYGDSSPDFFENAEALTCVLINFMLQKYFKTVWVLCEEII